MTSRCLCDVCAVSLRSPELSLFGKKFLIAEMADTNAQRTRNSTFTPQMKQAATAGLVLVLCVVSAAQESDTTFKVDVKLVNVFVTVTDERGGPVAGLKKDNFELTEDDKAQKVALFDKESALPLNIVVAID